MSFSSSYFAQLLAWTILNFTWQGAFLALSSRACDFLLRKSSATARYRVFHLHWAALILAPLLTVLLAHNALVSIDPSKIADVVGNCPLPLSPVRAFFLRVFHSTTAILPYLLLIWIGGAAVAAGRVFRQHVRFCRMHRFRPYRGKLTSVIHELARNLGIKILPAVLEAETASPFVTGMGRQRLVLPRRMEAMLQPEEIRAVLAHELAHVRRADYTSNLLQTGLAVLLWPHPAVWMLRTRLRQEREACCDEIAVEACGAAVPLARALYRLAVNVPVAGMAVPATAGPLELRMQRLLAAPRHSLPPLFGITPLLAAAALVLATLSAAQTLPADGHLYGALLASPVGPAISIHAEDPAGPFLVQLRRGRVLGVSFGDQSVPRKQLVQQGGSVKVLDRAGKEVLALQVDPRGAIRWNPREKNSRSHL